MNKDDKKEILQKVADDYAVDDDDDEEEEDFGNFEDDDDDFNESSNSDSEINDEDDDEDDDDENFDKLSISSSTTNDIYNVNDDDETNILIKNKNIFQNYAPKLSKFEKAKVLAVRGSHIQSNLNLHIDSPRSMSQIIKIADRELCAGTIPLVVHRHGRNNVSTQIPVEVLHQPEVVKTKDVWENHNHYHHRCYRHL
ncbi:hypothetical protein [Trichoplusia ni ascovirus 6b]|nr:hypothetical protein [Trichoplusia ni ascovirus 6b]